MAYAPVAAPERAVNPLLLVGFISGGLLLLLGVGLVLAVLVVGNKKKKNLPEVAAVETPHKGSQPQPRPAANTSPQTNGNITPVRAPHIDPGSDTANGVDTPPVQILTPVPEKPRLPPEEQKRVDKAIDKGLAFLTQVQGKGLSRGYPLGHMAIIGLTLLECGVPANDPRVRESADYVRLHAPRINDAATTYQISLSLLFLDRLGDKQDEKLIRTMGLRLVAGQGNQGGWNYNLPQMQEEVEQQFLTALTLNRPLEAVSQVPTQPRLPTERTDPARPPASDPSGVVPNPPIVDTPRPRPDPEATRRAIATLPPHLRKVPGLWPADQKKPYVPGVDGDNSNTQFAALALWVAGRHGVPIEMSMAQLGQRFRHTQGADGNWAYRPAQRPGPGAMTGAGLLGLAVAHGVDPRRAPGDGKPAQDEHIQKGLAAFGQVVGKPMGTTRKRGRFTVRVGGINYYYLWTLERVAVLYRLETLNGRDWYAWGAELIVDSQQADGHWGPSAYPGSEPAIDTCFALLFLKRANLVRDLTQKLEYVVDAKDPGTSK